MWGSCEPRETTFFRIASYKSQRKARNDAVNPSRADTSSRPQLTVDTQQIPDLVHGQSLAAEDHRPGDDEHDDEKWSRSEVSRETMSNVKL